MVGVSLVAIYGADSVTFFATDFFSRGKRLTTAPTAPNGVVPVPPAALAEAAGRVMGRKISVDIYAIARMIRSEGANKGGVRAHVAHNKMREMHLSPVDYVTFATKPWSKGFFGKQYSARYYKKGGGETWDVKQARAEHPRVIEGQVRQVASNIDPYEGDVLLAEQVAAERAMGVDKASGATRFLDKSAMGKQEGTGTAAAKIAEWKGQGFVAFTLPETGSDLVLFRKA